TRGTRRAPVHVLECLLHVGRSAVRKAGDDRAAREDFGIGREHDGRHGASGGEARDEDARRVDVVRGYHAADHLWDRFRLAATALDIAGLKPIEATVWIV